MNINNIESMKVLTIIQNEDLRETLILMLSEYFNHKNIYVSDNEKDALWKAMDILPNIIVLTYNSYKLKSYELMKRLKNSVQQFQGIIIYSHESEDYEEEFRRVISHKFNGTIFVHIDELRDIMNNLFAYLS